MKTKTLLVVAAISILNFQFTVSQAQELKIKKGKVTMSEEYYNSIKKQLTELDAAKARIAELEKKLAVPTLSNFNDSASYAIGRDMYTNWTQRQLGINAKMAAQAMLDDANGYSQLSDAQAAPLLQRFQMEFEKRQHAGIQKNIDDQNHLMEFTIPNIPLPVV